MLPEVKKAWLSHITSLSSHDGPGMRTTLFFKGCSLQCSWCHNPETIHSFPDLEWQSRTCIACRRCELACLTGAINFQSENGFPINQQTCTRCFNCVEHCPSGALKPNGTRYSVDQIVRKIEKEEKLLKKMGGGITFSGGEPALQADFIAEVARELKERHLHTALDTCGQAPISAYENLLPLMDLLLFDMKEFDSLKHKQFTGAGNEKIVANLFQIANHIREKRLSTQIWVRTPLIPGATATEENVAAIAHFLSDNFSDLVERWELCAFNNLCISKYRQLGREWKWAGTPLLNEADMAHFLSVAKKSAPHILFIKASGLTKK